MQPPPGGRGSPPLHLRYIGRCLQETLDGSLIMLGPATAN